jgi:hypothetical protein
VRYEGKYPKEFLNAASKKGISDTFYAMGVIAEERIIVR